jgi:MazG family protein
MEELLSVMKQLRDPVNGCAWDVKQNFQTIAAYTLEEAYEVVDAIERGDLNDLKDELGDLLLQVVFHAQMASEQAAFDFNDVASAIVEKMIRRHPHVFADVSYGSEAELKAAWDSHKATERQAKADKLAQADGLAQTDDSRRTSPASAASAMDAIARTLPALVRASKIQTRAARVGFDWPTIEPVWAKLDEEVAEVKEAMQTGNEAAVQEEMGDLLFTVVNLARHAEVDAEAALRQACHKFDQRFRLVEQFAEESAQTLADLDLDSLDSLWERSKQSS